MIETKVERYPVRLSFELLRVTGGDRLPAEPIHLVDDGLIEDGGAP